jgi:hypothetical protein
MFNSTAGNLVDRVTQRWVQFTGVPIDLQTHSWLHGRIGGPKGIGKEYFNELAQEQGRGGPPFSCLVLTCCGYPSFRAVL